MSAACSNSKVLPAVAQTPISVLNSSQITDQRHSESWYGHRKGKFKPVTTARVKNKWVSCRQRIRQAFGNGTCSPPNRQSPGPGQRTLLAMSSLVPTFLYWHCWGLFGFCGWFDVPFARQDTELDLFWVLVPAQFTCLGVFDELFL